MSPRSRADKAARSGRRGPQAATGPDVIADVIASRAFELVYQPIVHLDTGTVAGVEALCRFTDGASPEWRFKESERLGLAADLDLAIIDVALAHVREIPSGYVSINLSPSTLLDARLGDLLLAPDVPRERLVVEVTEHARITDYERAEELLAAIRSSGIRLAVDDAGAGYATFRHVLQLRPDVIKMDRSITQDIDSDTARRALATALVIFAGELGATVVAEGVETDDEILALRRAGIHRAQGFALAHPAPLPHGRIDYQPMPMSELLELPRPPSEPPSLDPPDGNTAVWAHGLLASIGGIAGVLDVLNERLVTIGEDRYRGLVATAQRQAHHVEGSLRRLVQGLPPETRTVLLDPSTVPSRIDDVEDRPDHAPAPAEEPDSVQARARLRLRSAADALSTAQSDLEDTVSLGRASGITWDEIAEILGMTRQGASKRFGKGRLG